MSISWNEVLKYFLPSYFTVYVGMCFVWRSVVVWKRTGINPFVIGRSDNLHDYVGKLFKVSVALAGLVVLIYCFSQQFYSYLVPIPYLEMDAFKAIGSGALLLSLAWTTLAQAQMGDSWRIGIDKKNATVLVEKGIFRCSRNPIFLGMILTMIGLFLILPNAVTLLVLILGTCLIQIQVRLEEEHLNKLHGAAYLDYCRRARRWL